MRILLINLLLILGSCSIMPTEQEFLEKLKSSYRVSHNTKLFARYVFGAEVKYQVLPINTIDFSIPAEEGSVDFTFIRMNTKGYEALYKVSYKDKTHYMGIFISPGPDGPNLLHSYAANTPEEIRFLGNDGENFLSTDWM